MRTKEKQLDLIPLTEAEALRRWRKDKGWTRKQAAKHFGVSERSIENWEYGERTPVALRLWAINRRSK